MKAFVFDKSNAPDVLIPREVDKPLPKENQVLVKNKEEVLAIDENLFEESIILRKAPVITRGLIQDRALLLT